jgi:hypothetical protein
VSSRRRNRERVAEELEQRGLIPSRAQRAEIRVEAEQWPSVSRSAGAARVTERSRRFTRMTNDAMVLNKEA